MFHLFKICGKTIYAIQSAILPKFLIHNIIAIIDFYQKKILLYVDLCNISLP